MKTPTPWHLNTTESHGEAVSYAAVIIGAESAGSPCVASLEFGGTIETDSATTKANAEFIVRAVNSHDAIVARLFQGDAFANSFLAWAEQLRSVGRTLPGMEARENEARGFLTKSDQEKGSA